jgi:4-hydroxybenzoate polyprenyltransferase
LSTPLVVDLDGTLIRTDMLHESALRALRDDPLSTLKIPVWLSAGKAVLKRELAQRTPFDPSTLPYNAELLAWLQEQKDGGRRLILCTASDHGIADVIAGHLGLFDEVMASEGRRNLAGGHKAEALVARFGERGFDYAGNSQADLEVWAVARRAVVVNGSDGLAQSAGKRCEVEAVFASPRLGLRDWLRVLRVHQWLKNLLLFVPILAAFQIDGPRLATLAIAFLSFSLCASAVYIGNDLFDLESDRIHPRKRKRPFASGRVPAWKGVALAPVLLLASAALARTVGPEFIPWLTVYFLLTCAYSWQIKRMMLADCVALAALYTLRVIAGGAAAGLALSFWLLAFSGFLFLSLAFVKRYAELEVQLASGREKVHGRGYLTTDAPLIMSMGVASAYAAVLVLSLYLNSDAIVRLYRAPEFIWAAVPVMLFWVSWMWMQAHRGQMHDDPLVFAVKDPTSLLAGGLFAAVLLIGHIGWRW